MVSNDESTRSRSIYQQPEEEKARQAQWLRAREELKEFVFWAGFKELGFQPAHYGTSMCAHVRL
jgi:hypothetical protein